MSEYIVKVYELDSNDNRTENVLHQESVLAKSKIEAYSIVGKSIKNNGIHSEHKHHYTMAVE